MQRTQEIGIRVALGAPPRRVLALVIKEGALLIGVGCGVGWCGARLLMPYLKGLLYDVSPADPRTYAAVVLALSITGALTMYAPARRATAIEPIVALRHE